LAPTLHDSLGIPSSDPLPSQGQRASPIVPPSEAAPCQVCQLRNPADATFCTACGTRLYQPCAHCGHMMEWLTPVGSACGHPGPGAGLAMPSSPSPALAGGGAERKPVTVLCCGVTHGDSQGEPHALETLHRRMHTLQALVRDIVLPYGGQVH